jgi:hypothetical protein
VSNSKTIFAGVLLALFALALLVSPSGVLAKKKQLKAKGTIVAIDLVASTVTVHDNKSDTDVAVTVDESTRIHKNNDEHASIEDLAVGDKADARYNKDTLVAKRIQAKSPKPAKVHGTITAIDLGAQSVTIQPKEGDAVTVLVTETTKIERNEEEATLADLVVGDHANAKYDALTFQAVKISAEEEETDE